ncbi:MAG: hypothetical protein IJM20_07515 [Clostridia bacterium]|nr:hypothetical protein [Clostridia bacterium]
MKENPETAQRTADMTAAERIDAIAGSALASVSARAEEFRKKLPPKRAARSGEQQPATPAVGTVEYRMPEAVRAMQEAILNGDARARRQENAEMRRDRAKLRTPEERKAAAKKAAPERRARRESRMQLLQRLSDEVAEELPLEFFEKLDGGIALTDGMKVHPRSDPKKPLLILGEYRNDRNLGRSIMLYGGSILRTYGHLPEAELKKELRGIIRHEFTHHIESLCGERGLEVWDEYRLAEYQEGLKAEK